MEGRYIPYQWPSDNSSDDDKLGHPGFNYSSHGMDNSRASASYRDDPTVAMLRVISEVWLSMPIALFGIIGNLVSLVVLCYHRRLKKLQTIVIQLQGLAVVDTLILITILLLRSFRYIGPAWYVGVLTRIYPWMYATVYFLRLLSVWLTVLLTVDRYIAVWYPLDARRLCTVKRTYIVMTIITLCTLAFCLPRYFEYTLKQFDNNHVGFVSTDLLDNYMYNIVYRISLFILVQYVLPTLALVYLNARVIVALRRSDTYRSSATRRHPPPPPTPVTSHPPDVVTSSSQSTRSITVVVAVIVTICIVVHVVALTAHVVATVQTNLKTPRSLEPVRRHLVQASNVLVTINSAVNFIVYCMISRKFRELLVHHCCCSSASSSLSSLSRRQGEQGCCCWRVGRWCRRTVGQGSWRQSEANDSKRSTTGTNHSEPRTNFTPVQLNTLAKQQTVQLTPHDHHQKQQQQQQQQLVEMRQLNVAAL